MLIRPVRAEDIPAILDFWNPLIRTTTVTFSDEEKTADGVATMIATRRAASREFLVAEDAGQVLGFATYDQYRGGTGYRHAMEHTIILADAGRGRGAGRALMLALEDHARQAGAHTMVAAVSAENAAGVAFHRALDYQYCGLQPESGRKFDRWLDLVLLQKIL